MADEMTKQAAESAMRSMEHLGVLPTPANFAVWFHYQIGSPASLKRTIEILLANKRTIDESVSRDLFTMYIESTKAVAGFGLQERIAGVIADAQRYLAVAIADNRQQIRDLDGIAGQVAAKSDPRSLIEQLVDQLTQASERATTLEAGFAATTSELDKVRHSFDEAEERSKVDELTGLANRRALDAFLRTAQMACMESGKPLSILLLDVDHFKKFNDTYGHQAGDQVLRLVAHVIKDNMRETDLAARYGGEELMAVLPDARLPSAVAVAERIRSALAERPLRRRSTGEELSAVTASIGVAQFIPGESVKALIARCDRALYLAKASGRNRTVSEAQCAQSGCAA